MQNDELERKSSIKTLLQTLDYRSLTKDDLMNLSFYSLVAEDPDAAMLISAIINLKDDTSTEGK